MTSIPRSAVAIFGSLVLAACSQSSQEASEPSSDDAEEYWDQSNEVAAAGPADVQSETTTAQQDGPVVWDCKGRSKIESTTRRGEIPFAITYKVDANQKSPVRLIEDDGSETEVCNYDCVFNGTSDDFTMQIGHTRARNTPLQEGVQLGTHDIRISNGVITMNEHVESLRGNIYNFLETEGRGRCTRNGVAPVRTPRDDQKSEAARKAADEAAAAVADLEAAMADLEGSN